MGHSLTFDLLPPALEDLRWFFSHRWRILDMTFNLWLLRFFVDSEGIAAIVCSPALTPPLPPPSKKNNNQKKDK